MKTEGAARSPESKPELFEDYPRQGNSSNAGRQEIYAKDVQVRIAELCKHMNICDASLRSLTALKISARPCALQGPADSIAPCDLDRWSLLLEAPQIL